MRLGGNTAQVILSVNIVKLQGNCSLTREVNCLLWRGWFGRIVSTEKMKNAPNSMTFVLCVHHRATRVFFSNNSDLTGLLWQTSIMTPIIVETKVSDWSTTHRGDMSSIMTSSNGNIYRVTGPFVRGTGGFPSQRPVMQSFDVFFDLHLDK